MISTRLTVLILQRAAPRGCLPCSRGAEQGPGVQEAAKGGAKAGLASTRPSVRTGLSWWIRTLCPLTALVYSLLPGSEQLVKSESSLAEAEAENQAVSLKQPTFFPLLAGQKAAIGF